MNLQLSKTIIGVEKWLPEVEERSLTKLIQDLRTGNGKSNHRGRREASAPFSQGETPRAMRLRDLYPYGDLATRSVSLRRSNWRDTEE
ncbi:MAG: hypothetical protein V7K92_17415 [Nostoc sp.]|uniref:hypothetical protein n=1 Tax=Nostoc sp. TaxID=1180 RepID=UPI002FF25FAA